MKEQELEKIRLARIAKLEKTNLNKDELLSINSTTNVNTFDNNIDNSINIIDSLSRNNSDEADLSEVISRSLFDQLAFTKMPLATKLMLLVPLALFAHSMIMLVVYGEASDLGDVLNPSSVNESDTNGVSHGNNASVKPTEESSGVDEEPVSDWDQGVGVYIFIWIVIYNILYSS